MYLPFAPLFAAVVEKQELPGYTDPVTSYPLPSGFFFEWLDVGVLAAVLVATIFAVHFFRSRKSVLGLTLFSVAYFGFYRDGCVCAVGSLQNIVEGLANPAYSVPLAVVAIFALPLVVALFFGRMFCAAACPLGALQELFSLWPLQLPRRLQKVLSLLPYFYLGVAVLFVATGMGYLICRYDPFVGLFRLNGPWYLILAGIAMLALSTIIGRPYCRFLCPYGALLGVCSRNTLVPVKITPHGKKCDQCRLCEKTCPYGAIELPQTQPYSAERARRGRILLLLTCTLPLFLASGGWLGWWVGDDLAQLHPHVVLLAQVTEWEERASVDEGTPISQDVFAWLEKTPKDYEPKHKAMLFDEGWSRQKISDATPEAIKKAILEMRVTKATDNVALASLLLGFFLSLVLWWKLVAAAVIRKREDYLANPARCVGCARCFRYCPEEGEE